jgi:hypothetical protein
LFLFTFFLVEPERVWALVNERSLHALEEMIPFKHPSAAIVVLNYAAEKWGMSVFTLIFHEIRFSFRRELGKAGGHVNTMHNRHAGTET